MLLACSLNIRGLISGSDKQSDLFHQTECSMLFEIVLNS
jgi:hypothetical protein